MQAPLHRGSRCCHGSTSRQLADLWAAMAAPAAKAQDPFAIGPSCYGFGGRRVPGRRRLHGLLDVCPSMPCPVDLPYSSPMRLAACVCAQAAMFYAARSLLMPWILVKIHLSISVPNILFSFLHAETNIARGCSKVYQYSGILTLQSTDSSCVLCVF